MKRTVRIAWATISMIVATALLFFLPISSARAPKGGKNSLGGRTIASMQEEEFDHRLLKYQVCYGVQFRADTATLERRRVCKAILVHHMDLVLEKPGTFLKNPIEFRCENTVFGKNEKESSGLAFLRPNSESDIINKILEQNIESKVITEESDSRAREACEFLTSCKISMRRLAFRELWACVSTNDAMHRRVILDEISTRIFENQVGSKILYAELIEDARK